MVILATKVSFMPCAVERAWVQEPETAGTVTSESVATDLRHTTGAVHPGNPRWRTVARVTPSTTYGGIAGVIASLVAYGITDSGVASLAAFLIVAVVTAMFVDSQRRAGFEAAERIEAARKARED